MNDQQSPPQAPTPPQGPQVQVALNMTPQGLAITMAPAPITINLPEEVMAQLVKQWLATHEALLQEIVRETAAQKRKEIEIIQHVRNSKNG